MENLKETQTSLTTQSAWIMIAKIIGFALSFLLPFLVVRILSQSDFGIYRQVFMVIANANSLLAFGMGMSAYYFLAREKERQPFYIFNILLFNFIVGGLACLFLNIYPQFLGNLFKDEIMTRLAPQIGVVIWIWMFSAFLEVVAIANQESKLATLFIVFAQLTKTILMVSAVYYFQTVESMLTATTIQVSIQTIILLIYLNSRFKGFWHSFDRSILRQQLKYTLPFGMMGLLWILQSEAHMYFVGNRFTSQEMAIYAAGCFELPLLGILYESVSSVMIPKMSEMQSHGRFREMIELSINACEKLSFFYFPVFCLLLITATTFITTLFTHKYDESVPIFMINIILLPSYILITDPIVRSYEYLGKFILKVRIIIVALMLSTFALAMKYLDLEGMITIVVITALIERVITVRKICQYIGFGRKDFYLLRNVGKIGMVSILASLPTYFIYNLIKGFTSNIGNNVSLFIFSEIKINAVELVNGSIILGITGLFYLFIYIALLFAFKVISDPEKEFIYKKLKKLNPLNR